MFVIPCVCISLCLGFSFFLMGNKIFWKQANKKLERRCQSRWGWTILHCSCALHAVWKVCCWAKQRKAQSVEEAMILPEFRRRHTTRHLSIDTCLFWKAAVTVLRYQGLWIKLQQSSSVFLRSRFSLCVTAGLRARGLAISSQSKAVSRCCDLLQFV